MIIVTIGSVVFLATWAIITPRLIYHYSQRRQNKGNAVKPSNIQPTHNESLIRQIKSMCGEECIWIGEVGDDIVMIQSLIFHCALQINPKAFGGCEQRYCYHNADLAFKAIAEYVVTGEWRYWKKDHTKNISVAFKNQLFRAGDSHCVQNSIGQVEWDIDELKKEYPHSVNLY